MDPRAGEFDLVYKNKNDTGESKTPLEFEDCREDVFDGFNIAFI